MKLKWIVWYVKYRRYISPAAIVVLVLVAIVLYLRFR